MDDIESLLLPLVRGEATRRGLRERQRGARRGLASNLLPCGLACNARERRARNKSDTKPRGCDEAALAQGEPLRTRPEPALRSAPRRECAAEAPRN